MLYFIFLVFGFTIFATTIAATIFGMIRAVWYYTRAPKFHCPSCGRVLKQRTFKPKRQKCPRCKATVWYDYRDAAWKVVEPVKIVFK